MAEQGSPEKNTIATIERAVDILMLFTRTSTPSLGVTEIASQLDLSKAVVHRVLATLRTRGLIEFDELSRRYSLGPASLMLGDAYLSRIDVRDLARGTLRRLCERTNETATLSIRTKWSRAYIDQVTPAREVRMAVPLGQQFPLHLGGSSKAFLAFLAEAERERYLADEVPADEVDAARLRGQLAEIRARGYATSFGERQPGAGSVAAPVFDRHGAVAAVVSVCGPLDRFRRAVGPVSALLMVETVALSRRLGYPA